MLSAEMDFRRDWFELMKARLAGFGYVPPAGATHQDVGVVYANALLRLIDTRPRAVLESRDLVVPPELRAGYDLFVGKAQRGEDLNPHLSKGVVQRPDEPDPLFNDWGIHHFHLGLALDASGHIERTGPLLFALVTDTAVHAINIIRHGAWHEQRMVQCIHENWPDVIAHHRLRGLSVAPITNQDVKDFRKGGVLAFVTMPDGTTYAPPGGGISTDLTGVRAVTESDRAFMECDRQEEWVRKNLGTFAAQMTTQGKAVPDKFKFRLVAKKDGLYAFDSEAKVLLKLPRFEAA